MEHCIATAEGSGGEAREDALSRADQTVKRLAGMKRSYNLEIKLMGDPASKVRGGSGTIPPPHLVPRPCGFSEFLPSSSGGDWPGRLLWGEGTCRAVDVSA